MKVRLRSIARSVDARHGLIMAAATLVAGAFDYLTQVIVARLLAGEISVFLAVTALLQVLVHATNVIRNVAAFYTAELTVQPDRFARISLFLQRRWRWAWRWGLVATAVSLLLAPLLARWLNVGTLLPFVAAAFTVLLLFLRPVTDGGLQGLQQFFGLGSVQVLQAVLRVLLAPLLIWLGWRSFGALLSLPLAMFGGLLLALLLLRGYFRADVAGRRVPRVSMRYSIYTLVGLLAFALLINLDAIVVRAVFPAAVANNYGPVITLGKMNLFVPLGLGLVLFPKATQRQAAGRDPRPVLLLTLAATLLPGLLLTSLYFLFPGQIVALVFGAGTYADPGVVLGLVGLATTLFAGVYIWLNYALSLEKRPFVLALALIVAVEAAVMLLYHPTVVALATVMVAAGLAGNLVGMATTLDARGVLTTVSDR